MNPVCFRKNIAKLEYDDEDDDGNQQKSTLSMSQAKVAAELPPSSSCATKNSDVSFLLKLIYSQMTVIPVPFQSVRETLQTHETRHFNDVSKYNPFVTLCDINVAIYFQSILDCSSQTAPK